METRLLREKEVYPNKEVLEKALGESYLAFNELMETISNEKYALVPDWRSYKDGQSWLCKVSNKKRLCVGFQFGTNSLKLDSILPKKHV